MLKIRQNDAERVAELDGKQVSYFFYLKVHVHHVCVDGLSVVFWYDTTVKMIIFNEI